MKLDLVDHRGNAGFIDQTLEVMDLKVTDPNTLYQPLFLQRDHAFPGVDIVIDSRYGPVHQIEIEIIKLQFFQTLLQGFAGTFLIVIPQLSGDKQLFPRHARCF
ncbi:Uncharacterised protein [Salmonella enterica subsp. enterica serovar Bovismorbificans]|uniref:Uncharacterized protein n=1 Tax=Salmonella enterica subsp. enterica serovar Bovismorbificans TaxID=58097 RepID=A0A655ENW4_SALET|nr:Uncharacterised protein [Salmonella enterica subsp. enterica serovar Bovismorbificans]CNT87169.1 Uncharacterised protein [Salmonella enterica subsp. enterica serovar Bovismorbificans]CNV27896.1 Uncharacterised protein [Salmonella enterica subsp. enterica serovar Bovismorbificans]CPR48498.1 Uncharacterised protein [Salmonella enterica subsp. enterica serovar Bovismorbificans]CPR53264.1 Uncharacterised protein [Salmonella enterica subsp. enterica serovar Bovismorbificans]